jgi:hypothetical protein
MGPRDVNEVADDVAKQIVKRGLTAPAVMFLEMNKPLTYIAGQGLIVTMPFIAPFLGADRLAKFSRFLQTPANVERLIQRIEELADEEDFKEKSEKGKTETSVE